MKQSGFTLIELLIVVAIIGVLTAFAAVAYQNYVIRSRVSEGLTRAEAAKVAVSETTISKNAFPANQAETGYTSPNATAYVRSITIGRNGRITITYTAAAGNGTIILRPTLQASGVLTWTCTTGTLQNQYRPAICRP